MDRCGPTRCAVCSCSISRLARFPGAKTVADVRRYYEAKVPMNRGCLPVDVARAVMYCVEQKYETGQAIPVTGGQVMLNWGPLSMIEI